MYSFILVRKVTSINKLLSFLDKMSIFDGTSTIYLKCFERGSKTTKVIVSNFRLFKILPSDMKALD